MTKYEALAKELNKQIVNGQFKPNSKIPSIRNLCQRHEVSVSTVIRALEILETNQVVHSRHRSGVYVSPTIQKTTPSLEPEPIFTLDNPTQIDNKRLVLGLMKSFYTPNLFNLGATIPHQKFLPKAGVDKAAKTAVRLHSDKRDKYQTMPGNHVLRQQISQIMQDNGCDTSPENIVITSGCQEAFYIGLLSCCEKGDTVAVEAPTYPGFLQACEIQGIDVLEIPTSPSQGISLGALELAIQQWDISAVTLSGNYSNPTCARMPTEKKKALLKLCTQNSIKIIEDDIYADLSHDPFYRPRPIKSYDENDTVIYCNSFSKTISPGLRIGWVVNNALQKDLEYNKYVAGLSSVTLSQDILVEYLKTGKYERYLQNARRLYGHQVQHMSEFIHEIMPEGTRITQPSGGFLLWLSLPKDIDTLALLEKTAAKNVSFYPGTLFSAKDKFNNCLRINCAVDTEDPRLKESLKIIFGEAHKLL